MIAKKTDIHVGVKKGYTIFFKRFRRTRVKKGRINLSSRPRDIFVGPRDIRRDVVVVIYVVRRKIGGGK